jgi:hypothetical protein
MDQWMIDRLREEVPGKALWAPRFLAVDESRAVRALIARAIERQSHTPGLAFTEAVAQSLTPLLRDNDGDIQPIADTCRRWLMDAQGGVPAHVLLNWDQFERLVEVDSDTFLEHIDYFWLSSRDDLDVVNPHTGHVLCIWHYGDVSAFVQSKVVRDHGFE